MCHFADQGTISVCRPGGRRGSNPKDAIAVADSYGTDTTFTTTRQLNVTAPTASNIAAARRADQVEDRNPPTNGRMADYAYANPPYEFFCS
jgi:hypothetical protein